MVNGSDMTFLTYFNNLLEIQSTPVLVLGFKLSMILLVMSTVITLNQNQLCSKQIYLTFIVANINSIFSKSMLSTN